MRRFEKETTIPSERIITIDALTRFDLSSLRLSDSDFETPPPPAGRHFNRYSSHVFQIVQRMASKSGIETPSAD